jgi:hypothetical protein
MPHIPGGFLRIRLRGKSNLMLRKLHEVDLHNVFLAKHYEDDKMKEDFCIVLSIFDCFI